MNENIDLIKILKNCPKGFELYSPLFGNVKLNSISGCYIEIIDNIGAGAYFNKLGQYVSTYEVLNECLLFPSKEQRDWNKFTAPWYKKTECFNPWRKKDKKKRFNPKTLHTYDKVLIRENYPTEDWHAASFSHLEYDVSKYYLDAYEEAPEFLICTTGSCVFCYCIPYNDETKHLVGTTEEAPEYYRYWED